jgi:hypothetical protein
MSTVELRGYAAHIAEGIGSADPALLALVEDFMRLEHGTLDALSAGRFTTAARRALADVLAWRDAGDVDGHTLGEYCATMRLDYPERWPDEPERWA